MATKLTTIQKRAAAAAFKALAPLMEGGRVLLTFNDSDGIPVLGLILTAGVLVTDTVMRAARGKR